MKIFATESQDSNTFAKFLSGADMPLPIEINPNPLFTSAVEIRFKTNIEREQLLSKVYPALSNTLPEIQTHNPFHGEAGSASDTRLADFTLANQDYSLSFGSNFVTFENVDEYKLWKNYFPFIKSQIKALFEIGIFEQIERVGLRFINILDITDFPENALVSMPTLNLPNYQNNKVRMFSTIIQQEDVSINLTVAPLARAEKNNIEKVGLAIDIDCFIKVGTNASHQELINQIDRLHTTEKELFFSLLKEEYIKEFLNPIYT